MIAKQIIKLIHSVADVVNHDPDVADRLKVVFIPNFNVTNGQPIYPAADVSEQISTAGKEASGTGNMKFAMNGALTIGTLDGANVEIRERVGSENFFLFGLTCDELADLTERGYSPRRTYETIAPLRQVVDSISNGYFSNGDRDLYRPLVDSLLLRDEFFLLADYEAYITRQQEISVAFSDQQEWTRKSILNVARMGYFSSDRAISEYCSQIWDAKPVRVELE